MSMIVSAPVEPCIKKRGALHRIQYQMIIDVRVWENLATRQTMEKLNHDVKIQNVKPDAKQGAS